MSEKEGRLATECVEIRLVHVYGVRKDEPTWSNAGRREKVDEKMDGVDAKCFVFSGSTSYQLYHVGPLPVIVTGQRACP